MADKKKPKRSDEMPQLKWLKSKHKREANLFFSLCRDEQEYVLKEDFKKALKQSGLQKNDDRLRELFERLDAHGDNINFDDFSSILRTSGLLVEKALRGELAIPDFIDFSKNMDLIFDEVESFIDGDLASYIPPLAEVNPDQFGVAIVTIDGQIYQRGDSCVDFSIQSICKPFNYCFAMEKLGFQAVHHHVGQEPSGRQFNDLTLMQRNPKYDLEKENSEVPFNPMVNSGAIMTAGLLLPELSNSQRLSFVREQFGQLIGWKENQTSTIDLPRFNKFMARQENFKGYNNFASAFLLMATGNLPYSESKLPNDRHQDSPDEFDFYVEPAVTRALKLYFSICSIEMTATDIAMAGATLANSGVCPITQDRVLSQETVRNCMPVLQMCGMYNGSGHFFQEIGLPAKSGVGGGVMLVVPQLMGICVFSPRLDLHGNSVRGIEMARRITSKYLVHLFDGTMTDANRIDPKVPIARWRANSCSEAIWAASNGSIHTLERLVNQQRDLQAGDYDRRTPLHLASAEGHLEVVEFLLDHGVQPIADRWGGFPIADAQNNNHQKIVDVFDRLPIAYTQPVHLVENIHGKTDQMATFDDELMVIELLFAAAENNVNGIRQLVAKGVPVHAGDYDSRTALHLAAAEGSLAAVHYLVTHGHPLYIRDRWGATPYDEAKRENRLTVMQYLNKLMD